MNVAFNVSTFKEKIGILYLTLFTFIFIYDPPVTILGGNFTTFLAIPSGLYLLVKILYFKMIPANIEKCFAIFFVIIVCLVICLFLPLLRDTNDFVLFKTYLIFLLVYFPTIFFIVDQFRYFRIFSIKRLFQIIVYISALQSAIMLIMFVNPEIKQQIFSVLRDDRSLFNMQSGGVRMLGFAYSAVWDLAFLQSIALVVIVPLISTANLRENLFYAFLYVIIFLSIILAGRTGFIGVIFSGIFFVIIIFNKNRKTLKSGLKFLAAVFLLISIAVSLYTVLVPSESREIITDKVVPWAFELFVKKNESGKFGTESSDELQKMYFPVPITTLIFGDARYVDANDPTHYYLETDAGYMRHILFYGLLGSAFLYSLYFLVFKDLIVLSFKNKQHHLAVMYAMLMIYFYIGHVKGDLLVGASMAIRLILLIYVFNISLTLKTSLTRAPQS